MAKEEVLAVILVVASGFLLFLVVITLCIIVKYVNAKTRKMRTDRGIPMSQQKHHYYNHALEHDGVIQASHNRNQDEDNTKPYFDQHKGQWPTNYNMHTISRSYPFPQTGTTSFHDNQSNPNSSTRTRSQNINHKTFSEEVFEVSYHVANSAPTEQKLEISNHNKGTSSPSKRQENVHGAWKYNTIGNERSPSETSSQLSMDRNSIATTSTASHHREYYTSAEHKPDYYSTFKPYNVYISPDGNFSAPESGQTNPSSVSSQEQMINYDKVNSSGNQKVFTFNIKQ